MAANKNEVRIELPPPDKPQPKKPASAAVGGSHSDKMNVRLLNDVVRAWWKFGEDSPHRDDWIKSATDSSIAMLFDCAPQNAVQGMVSAQMVAAHAAAMECYRRAALSEQSFEGREMNLKLGLKASRTMVTLTEALERLKGNTRQQTVSVHHHHHQTDARTQVAVRADRVNVSAPGQGDTKNGGQPHEREPERRPLESKPAETLDLGPPLRSEEPAGETVPVSGDEGKEAMPLARRKKPRSAEG